MTHYRTARLIGVVVNVRRFLIEDELPTRLDGDVHSGFQ